jgi:membrane fusion protein (multidrug efflux system)
LLATISTLDPIWFYCNVSEVQYLRAENQVRRTGRQLEELKMDLILGDGSVHPHPGHFVFIDRAVNVSTGTLRVRAEFENPEGVLRPGMFARIKVHLGTRSNSILVPERAVAELQGRYFVWVIDDAKLASQRPVKVGDSFNSHLLILEGLQPGERIVVEGHQKVRQGAAVRPMTAEEIRQASAQAGLPSRAKPE